MKSQMSKRSKTAVADWYSSPDFDLLSRRAKLAEGNLVLILPTSAQRDAGLEMPLILPVRASTFSCGRKPFFYASYSLSGTFHYYPLQRGVSYEVVGESGPSLLSAQPKVAALAADVLGRAVDPHCVVDLNFVYALQRAIGNGASESELCEASSTMFDHIGDYLHQFSNFFQMMEVTSSGLKFNWTYKNQFPAQIQ